MSNYLQKISLIFLLIIPLYMVYWAKKNWQIPHLVLNSSSGPNNGLSVAIFVRASYFLVNATGPALKLEASKITHEKKMATGTSSVLLENPKGVSLAQKPDQEEYLFEGMRGVIDQEKFQLTLEGKASILSETSSLKAQSLFFNWEEKKGKAKTNVETYKKFTKSKDFIWVKANEVSYEGPTQTLEYVGNVSGKIERRHKFIETLFFQCQKATGDYLKNKVQLFENVFLKRDSLQAWSKKGELFLIPETKRPSYFVLLEDVKVKQEFFSEKEKRKIKRDAFGEKLEGFDYQRHVILSGRPRVHQEKDFIKGETIVLRENTSVVEVFSGVTGLIIK